MKLSKKFTGLALAGAITLGITVNAEAENSFTDFSREDIDEYGDTMQYGMPAIAIGMALAKGDTEGVRDAIGSCLVTQGVAQILKYTFKDTAIGERPKGKAGMSFPSGHTAGAMCGAAFIQHRYGGKYGGPAFAAASGVAAARVMTDAHHIRDVVASTIISYVIADKMVKPYKKFDNSYTPHGEGDINVNIPVLSLKPTENSNKEVTFGIIKKRGNADTDGVYIGFKMKF